MYAKHRTVPLDVSYWMEKDVKIRKATVASGLMPDNTRYNVFLSRQFFSDMFNLSMERHRNVARFDHNRKMFLKKQRRKAERAMPGLLPYITPHTKDIDAELTSESIISKKSNYLSSSFQSVTAPSVINTESITSTRKTSAKTLRSSDEQQQQQQKLPSIARSQQRKGYHLEPIRPNIVGSLTARDLLGNLDESYYQSSLVSEEAKITARDKRFRQLLHVFTEVHEPKSTKNRSVKNIIESNASLQCDSKHWGTENTVEEEHEQLLFDDSTLTNTETCFVDACA